VTNLNIHHNYAVTLEAGGLPLAATGVCSGAVTTVLTISWIAGKPVMSSFICRVSSTQDEQTDP